MTKPSRDADLHKGAVEANTPDAPEHNANPLAPALTPEGLPADPVAIAQDRIGVQADDPEIANASETGETDDAPREEEEPLV